MSLHKESFQEKVSESFPWHFGPHFRPLKSCIDHVVLHARSVFRRVCVAEPMLNCNEPVDPEKMVLCLH